VGVGAEYSEAQWAESAGHRPLENLDVNQIVTLQRHHIWAAMQQRNVTAGLPGSKSPGEEGDSFYVSDVFSAWFLWAGLLWVVIEGFEDRDIEFCGQLAADIAHVRESLKRCRNAIFHVPPEPHDPRFFTLMKVEDVVAAMYRITDGLGRLFGDEQRARGIAPPDG
jgi:hypothetical protein